MAGRKRALRKVVLRDDDGKPVEVPLGQVTDYSEPQKDAKTGVIPEFVNISNKIQILEVPYNPNGAIVVPKYGILRGAQWRMFSEPRPVWGEHPPFLERELLEDDESSKKKKKYDEEYLLTEKQMIDEITALVRRKRIREILEASIILKPDELGADGNVEIFRRREDRADVVRIANDRLLDLEERDRARKEELGILDDV